MTTRTAGRRPFRPGELHEIGDRLWVVDEVQPVAALVDPRTAAVRSVIAWPELPPGRELHDRRVLPAVDGLWVQHDGGPVVHVRADGSRDGHHAGDGTLSVVSAHGAWCVTRQVDQDDEDHDDDEDEEGPADVSELRLLSPVDHSRAVEVEGDVRSVRSSSGDVVVEVRLPAPHEGATSWMRLAAGDVAPTRLTLADHGCADPGVVPARASREVLPTWLPPTVEPERGGAPVPHVRASGHDWHLGHERGGRWPHPLIALAVDDQGATVHRIDLGPASLQDVTLAGSALWIAVHRPDRRRGRGHDAPGELLRIDPATGEVEQAIGPDALDVAGRGWPRGATPVDAGDYESATRAGLAELDRFWTGTDGRVTPLATGMSDSRAELVGSWPDTCVEVTFDWSFRPGVRLRRRIPLYDVLGRVAVPDSPDIDLMEDLDTGDVPPASYAVAGVLDV
ncbi:hypothetical protein GCM10009737_26090 [Nocardioides lentus]|uniref:Uncharacterized protein n=1 Tax=Nocardioides lentus TaxID=338077 RepID=A0ABP5AUR0_9ACTN